MLKIKLNGKKGVDYNATIDTYFDDFVMEGFPVFLGGKGQFDGKEILLLGPIVGKNTKALILDGKNMVYEFNAHTLSGTLNKVTLATLGKSYKKGGEFKIDKKGLITGTTDTIEISGLKIANAKGDRGDVHDTIYALMGGAHESGGHADPTELMKFVNAEGHKVKGTKKNDSYRGTDHKDKIDLGKGNDLLNGKGGNDVLKGGKGKDTFEFDTKLGPNNVDKIKDFNPKDDTIHLSSTAFTGLDKGWLSNDAFAVGPAAKDGNDRIIYNKSTGALSFDADGNGSGAAVQFAKLAKNLDVSAHDFFVI